MRDYVLDVDVFSPSCVYFFQIIIRRPLKDTIGMMSAVTGIELRYAVHFFAAILCGISYVIVTLLLSLWSMGYSFVLLTVGKKKNLACVVIFLNGQMECTFRIFN